MDLRQLEYFVQVAECGSFTAAAEVLRIAQPSLSRQIRLLEAELKHPLFIRHGRGVVLTEAGRILSEHAKAILRQVHLSRDALNQLRAGLSGYLRLGIPSSLITLLGVPLVTGFRNKLPGVSLSITDGLSISMQDWLLSGRLDIALLYKPLPSAGLSTIPMLDEELFLFSHVSRKATAETISMAEVAELPLILPREPHEIRMLVEAQMAGIARKPNVALEVDSIPGILHFLSPDYPFAILPKFAVSIYAHSSCYYARRVVDPSLFSRLVLATSAKRATNALQDAALKLIAEICESALEPVKAASRHAHRMAAKPATASRSPGGRKASAARR